MSLNPAYAQALEDCDKARELVQAVQKVLVLAMDLADQADERLMLLESKPGVQRLTNAGDVSVALAEHTAPALDKLTGSQT